MKEIFFFARSMFSARLEWNEWKRPTHPTLTLPITALICHWRTQIIFVVGYATLPSGAKLFCAEMQMTAFIKGALLLIHCTPYRSFPKPQRFCSKRRGASRAAPAPVKGVLIRRGRVLGEWPAKSQQPPVFCLLCAWWGSLSLVYDLPFSAWCMVWLPQTHLENHTGNRICENTTLSPTPPFFFFLYQMDYFVQPSHMDKLSWFLSLSPLLFLKHEPNYLKMP